MQTHLVSKIMHQNLAIILRQFNYSKNSFIVLVPGLLFFVWFQLLCLPMLNEQQFYLFGQIQTSQTGDQLYGDTSPL